MALSSFVTLEVRPGSGSDSACSGGFDPSVTSPGTDYSQQNSAQVSFTDLVIGATTTNLTSVGNPFSSASVGNLIQITSGTNFTTGFYTVVSVSGVTATMDRSVGTAAATGGHGYLGGALNTISAAVAAAVAGNTIYFKGTYTATSAQIINFNSSATATTFTINGYGSGGTRNDGSKGTWTTATNNINLVDVSSLYNAVFKNIAFTNTAGTPGTGLNAGNALIAKTANAAQITVSNCTFSGFTVHLNFDWQNVGFTCTGLMIDQCNFGVSVSHGVVNTGQAFITGSVFNQCGGDGYRIIETTNANGDPGMVVFERNVFYKCGANGLTNQQNQAIGGELQIAILLQNLFHSNTTHGFGGPAGYAGQITKNNAFWNNGGYGIDNSGGAPMPFPPYNNAYGSNTSGARNNYPASAADVTLTADPCNSASTGDFTLNSTSGGGAALKSAGFQTSIQ